MKTGSPKATVELYGVPRLRAGRTTLTIPGSTLGEVLSGLVKSCPQLADLLQHDGQLNPHYLVSLNGQRFVQDLATVLADSERVLLMSADAGG